MGEDTTLYIDSNVLINAAADDTSLGDEARKIIVAIEANRINAVTSCLTLDEVCWTLRRADPGKNIETCRILLSSKIRFLDVTKTILRETFDVMQTFRLKPRDALHVATMKMHNVKHIISEDSDFDRVSNIQRMTIKQVTQNERL